MRSVCVMNKDEGQLYDLTEAIAYYMKAIIIQLDHDAEHKANKPTLIANKTQF